MRTQNRLATVNLYVVLSIILSGVLGACSMADALSSSFGSEPQSDHLVSDQTQNRPSSEPSTELDVNLEEVDPDVVPTTPSQKMQTDSLTKSSVDLAAAQKSQDERIRTESVELRPDGSRSVRGQLIGDNIVDYVVKAAAGQTLSVVLEGSNLQNYMNIIPPGTNVAMFTGSSSGNTFERVLPDDGEYTIRIYLMRPAANRGELSDYSLSISATGQPLTIAPVSYDGVELDIDTTVENFYTASTTSACSLRYSSAISECEMRVVRRHGTGITATVRVHAAGNLQRRILFVNGTAVASDAGSGYVMTSEHDDDNETTIVTFSLDGSAVDEQYEIYDILLIGD